MMGQKNKRREGIWQTEDRW